MAHRESALSLPQLKAYALLSFSASCAEAYAFEYFTPLDLRREEVRITWSVLTKKLEVAAASTRLVDHMLY